MSKMISIVLLVSAATVFAESVKTTGSTLKITTDAEDSALFKDGRSAWRIIVPDAASRYMRYAACELSNTVEKISGACLGIVDASNAPSRNVIRLTSGDTGELFDVFSVKTAPGEIILHGNTPRGTLFAVYAFLRDRLDARWYWPGETGEFLPKLQSFQVEPWEKEYRPVFGLREMSICQIWRHRHPDTERWFPKVFLNCGINSPEIRQDIDYVRITSGHYVSLPVAMEERQKMFAEHPDWFSMLGGRRDIKGIAGCWSNEGYYDYLVRKLARRIRDDRAVLANFYVADIMPRCECAKCTRDPDKSARWWNYYARLIEGIRKEIPGMTFAGLAYQEYRAIPGVKVKCLDHVDYCQYNRCYYHALEDVTCEMNARSMKEFRGWAAQAPLGLYGYEFDVFSSAVYLPMWRVFSDEMRVFKRMGLKRVKTEYNVDLNRLVATRNSPAISRPQTSQLASRLAYYAWAMAAFDPDLDMDALLYDFCRHVYGAGAEDMKAYHDMMADAWNGMKTHITYFLNQPRGAAGRFLTQELEEATRARLAAAAEAARGDDRASSEIALDLGCLDIWAKFAKEAREGGVVYDLKKFNFSSCGWPVNAHRDFSSAATVFFK